MESGLSCNIIVEKIAPGGVNSSQKVNNGSLTIGRNASKAICLKISNNRRTLVYRIKTLKVHGKLITSGKATIEAETDAGQRRILLSNASETDLRAVLKTLMVKFNCLSTPLKNKHLMINGEVDEISPLRPQELEKVNQKILRAQNANKNPTPRKDTTPVRRLQKRRILAQKNGLLEKKGPLSKKLKLTMETSKLNEQQTQIIAAARSGKSIFFTGAAGTGKSFVLQELIKVLPPDSTAVTASTGCAAAPLHGQTLHAFAGIGIGKKTIDLAVKAVRNKKSLLRNWKNVQTLIIDEISMVPADFFDLIEAVAREVNLSLKLS